MDTGATRPENESLRDPRDPGGHAKARHHRLCQRSALSKTFPASAFSAACEKVLRQDGHAALQYAASEGYAPLRKVVADMLPWNVDPALVLITTGSQQGLDLIAKVSIDEGTRVLAETPTSLGALQAFAPMEPDIGGVTWDDGGVDIADLVAKAPGARFFLRATQFPEPNRVHHA